MSNLQTLLDRVIADGLLLIHRPLAEKVAAEAAADEAAGRGDDARAKRRELFNLGYSYDGAVVCELCRAKVAGQELREDDGTVVAVCDRCSQKGGVRSEAY